MPVTGCEALGGGLRIAFQAPNMRRLTLMENESMPPCLMSRAILSLSCVMNASKPLAVDDPATRLSMFCKTDPLPRTSSSMTRSTRSKMVVERAVVELGLFGDHADGDVGEPMMLEQGPECVC